MQREKQREKGRNRVIKAGKEETSEEKTKRRS